MLLKRLFDTIVGLFILFLISPVLLFFCFLIYLQDFHNPFYVADRVGLNGKKFRMYKLRSMIKNADRSGVDSTASDDQRITSIGAMVRRYKLDELAQLINVVQGDMSLVGPRPNVQRETDLYTKDERRLLSIRPGITDFASISFSDEGDILSGSEDPDIDYNQLIRPGKGYLGLFYVDNIGLRVDLEILIATAWAIIDKPVAIGHIEKTMTRLKAPQQILDIATRRKPLVPTPPPGASNIVIDRDSIPD
jgi:lipopolysaccharide/colanic/teichoic acid biosynthesis glycosyltransferase